VEEERTPLETPHWREGKDEKGEVRAMPYGHSKGNRGQENPMRRGEEQGIVEQNGKILVRRLSAYRETVEKSRKCNEEDNRKKQKKSCIGEARNPKI